MQRHECRVLRDEVSARRVLDVQEKGLVLVSLAYLELTWLIVTAEDIRREPDTPT
ncbi:hypothetical protein [Bradyrhizobium sp. USDA 10063]